jgi:hypothetical protein
MIVSCFLTCNLTSEVRIYRIEHLTSKRHAWRKCWTCAKKPCPHETLVPTLTTAPRLTTRQGLPSLSGSEQPDCPKRIDNSLSFPGFLILRLIRSLQPLLACSSPSSWPPSTYNVTPEAQSSDPALFSPPRPRPANTDRPLRQTLWLPHPRDSRKHCAPLNSVPQPPKQPVSLSAGPSTFSCPDNTGVRQCSALELLLCLTVQGHYRLVRPSLTFPSASEP